MARESYRKFLPLIALLGLISCAGQAKLQEKDSVNQSKVTESSPATTQQNSSAKQFTPEENNEICERMYNGAWNDGNFALVDELIAPDGLDHSPLSSEKGTAGFKKIIKTFRDAMPGLRLTIEDEVYSGDRVVHRWKVQGKHTGAPLFGVPAKGKEITLTGISILRMENGKIAERWTQLDQFGLLQQLGVVPPQGKPPQ